MTKKAARITFSTSCDLNYLAQAHVLAKSVKEIYPESRFILGLNESNLELESMISELTDAFDRVLVGVNLHERYEKLSNRYGIVELCCATKPSLLRKCFETNSSIVIYLDPDTYLQSTLEEAINLIEINNVQAVFTPHLTKLGNLEMEVSSMKHGILNLGFLALKNDLETLSFLQWWNLRLETLCIRDPARGIFTDQTWAALAIGQIESRIIRDPGYNFATWNLSDHELTSTDENFLVDGSKLVFAHFSSFASNGIEEFQRKFNVKPSKGYDQLLSIYAAKVRESEAILAHPISFNREKIHYKARRFDWSTSRASLKIRFVDFLGIRNPVFLKFLMKQKNRLRKFFG